MPETGLTVHWLEDKRELYRLFEAFGEGRLYGDHVLRSERGPQWIFGQLCKAFRKVEAAGGWVRDPAGRYLWITRFGIPDLPKGKREAGESRRQAALREVEEECGLRGLVAGRKAGITHHIYKPGGKWYLKETHWYHMRCTDSRPPEPRREEDITQAGWYDREESLQLAGATYASLRTLVLANI